VFDVGVADGDPSDHAWAGSVAAFRQFLGLDVVEHFPVGGVKS
jgi:hypothetical protein